MAFLFAQLEQSEGALSETGKKEEGKGLTFEQLFSFLTSEESKTSEVPSALKNLDSNKIEADSIPSEDLIKLKQLLEQIEDGKTMLNDNAEQVSDVSVVEDKDVKTPSESRKKDVAEEHTDNQKITIQVIEQLILVWKKDMQTMESGSNQLSTDNGSIHLEQGKRTNELLLIKQKLQIHELVKGQANVSQTVFTHAKEEVNAETTQPSASALAVSKKAADLDNSLTSNDLTEIQKKEMSKMADSSSNAMQNISQDKPTTTSSNPLTLHKENIHQTIKQEVLQGNTSFKMINPEKIVVQLKPVDLGTVEVTVEKIGGEIHVKMHSDNSDVQNLLDGLADDIRDDLRSRDASPSKEQSFDREQNEKRREGTLVAKRDYGQEEENSSFEEQLIDMIGGNNNGYIGYTN
ncbi:hypothetical protein CN918_27680 [Priestia megaterium]|nr:hypothetical protein CN918_27680 [Priestia megaterium]